MVQREDREQVAEAVFTPQSLERIHRYEQMYSVFRATVLEMDRGKLTIAQYSQETALSRYEEIFRIL
jgi:hypothetical protein